MAARSGAKPQTDKKDRDIQAVWTAYWSARDQAATPGDGESGEREEGADTRLITTRNDLVIRYLELVKAGSTRLGSRLPAEVEIDDLMMEGVFGLIEAIDHFDSTRGIKFKTFAPKRILGAMLDYLRSIDRAPRLVRARAKQLNQAILSHQMRFGRPPTRGELAEILEVSDRHRPLISRQSMYPIWIPISSVR